jgi:ribonuclease P protein component
VVRNRVRRRIQGALASLRPGRDSALQPADVVFVVRPHTATVPYPTLAREVGASLALAIGYEA